MVGLGRMQWVCRRRLREVEGVDAILFLPSSGYLTRAIYDNLARLHVHSLLAKVQVAPPNQCAYGLQSRLVDGYQGAFSLLEGTFRGRDRWS